MSTHEDVRAGLESARQRTESGEFHRHVRAEAEEAVHSRFFAGAAILLLAIVTIAYAFFVWHGDRAQAAAMNPPRLGDSP